MKTNGLFIYSIIIVKKAKVLFFAFTLCFFFIGSAESTYFTVKETPPNCKMEFKNGFVIITDTISGKVISFDLPGSGEQALNVDDFGDLAFDEPEEHPENRAKFEISLGLAIVLVVGFLINLPFFLYWAKRQKGSDEVLFYNVEGKFTYFSVLVWIDQIESLYKSPLTIERKKIEHYYSISNKANKALTIFSKKIHDELLIKAFGENMIRTAFNRMKLYSKLVFLLDISILLIILYSTILFISITTSWIAAVFMGTFMGIMIAAPIWLILHLILNHSLKRVAKRAIDNGDGTALRIIMAQFFGAFGGLLWKDLYHIQGKSTWLMARKSRRGYF